MLSQHAIRGNDTLLDTVNRWVLGASALVVLIGFWQRNDLPSRIEFVPQLAAAPRQIGTAKPAFTVDYSGVRYTVEPQFDYDLYGLVVSYRQHDGTDSMHSAANDHLNAADICVAWSDTAFAPSLGKISFWNGLFTCNFETRDPVAWANMKLDQVSNNHLLSADPLVRDAIANVRIGDQIHIRGMLSSYGAGKNRRGTSTTREDTGDGACETIFVEQFEIVAAGTNSWRLAMYAALAVLAVTLAIYFKRPYRPYA